MCVCLLLQDLVQRPSYFFISLVLSPLNSLVWWEVPSGYVALGWFLFLQEQIKDIIIITACHISEYRNIALEVACVISSGRSEV